MTWPAIRREMTMIKIVKKANKAPQTFGGCTLFVDDNGVTAKKK